MVTNSICVFSVHLRTLQFDFLSTAGYRCNLHGKLVLVTYFFVGVDWDEIQRLWTYGIDSGDSLEVGSQWGTLFLLQRSLPSN